MPVLLPLLDGVFVPVRVPDGTGVWVRGGVPVGVRVAAGVGVVAGVDVAAGDGVTADNIVTAGLPDDVVLGAPVPLLDGVPDGLGVGDFKMATLRLRMVALRTPASLASQE